MNEKLLSQKRGEKNGFGSKRNKTWNKTQFPRLRAWYPQIEEEPQ